MKETLKLLELQIQPTTGICLFHVDSYEDIFKTLVNAILRLKYISLFPVTYIFVLFGDSFSQQLRNTLCNSY